MKETILGRVMTVGATALVAVLVLGLFAGSLLGQPVVLGFVETGSMSPTLVPGDGFIAVPPPLVGAVEVGDVVTFRSQTLEDRPGALTTHRVVGQTDGGFVTRGDANPFTDQQGGEPAVSRAQIVAVALQIDGHVVAVPSVGSFVGESTALLALAGETLGFTGSPQRLSMVLFAVVGTAFLLDELVAPGTSTRTRRRSTVRASGYDPKHILGVGLAVVLVVATVTMVAPSDPIVVEFDSIVADGVTDGGITAGTAQRVPLELSNSGLLPTVVFLDSPAADTVVDERPVVIAPRSTATVDVVITAPVEAGSYERQVTQQRYLGVLPPSLLGSLHAVHPWVAIAAVDGLLATIVLVVSRPFLRAGRIRFYPGRNRPAELSVRRGLRRLYRKK